MLINRAPVLTLWAAIVAQRLGYNEGEALTLGKAVAGYTAQFKGRSLGIYHKRKEKGEKEARKADEREIQIVELMGRQIPTLEEAGEIRAVTKDKAIDPDSVRRYFASKFGGDLENVTAAMEELAGSYEPEELNKIAFQLYEQFRPEIPKGKRGWGAKGELSVKNIIDLKKG
jgi:hypothetical protein